MDRLNIRSVESGRDHLRLDIAGTRTRFHFLWLRDNCPESRSPNGQRLHESNAIDPAIRPRSVDHSPEALHVVWSDGLASTYPVEFLSNWAYDGLGEAPDDTTRWDAEVGDRIRTHDYPVVLDDRIARRAWLADVKRYGFSLLRNVPPHDRKIFDVVGLFGFVRETNYGRLFDVHAEEAPTNLAYTPLPLSVHTDNPYRDPCPTLQLLHCLTQADDGGITAIADGFYAADRLRRQDPEAFALLTDNDVMFRYQSEDAILHHSGRIITLDAAGQPRRIRINNRSLAPLRLPYDRVLPFYSALFVFRSILEDETSQYRFRLETGDLILFDNERVLHGRIGQSIGPRHLQGCYADRDGLLSTLRILECHGDQV